MILKKKEKNYKMYIKSCYIHTNTVYEFIYELQYDLLYELLYELQYAQFSFLAVSYRMLN